MRVILDPREHSGIDRLVSIDIRQKRPGSLQPLKAYVIDEKVLRTGSENSPSQDNDLVVIRSAVAVAKFEAHFKQMWNEAIP